MGKLLKNDKIMLELDKEFPNLRFSIIQLDEVTTPGLFYDAYATEQEAKGIKQVVERVDGPNSKINVTKMEF